MKDTAQIAFPAFDRIRDASRRDRIPSLEIRKERLNTLREMVLANRAEIIKAIDEDFGGRSHKETELMEIVPLLSGIKNTKARLKGWMKDERRHVSMTFRPGSAWVRHEPLGVVGIISPWNYPLSLALSPLADALAAGNRAMIKPSELTPRLADLMKRMVADHFDADVVSVETGGVEVAQAFSKLPFDHLVFTGSTNVGAKVMEAASQNLTPVTLELGGKSPAIVGPDYPLDKAARSIVLGKLANAGQTCIAPDYALVPKDKVAEFAQAMLDRIEKAYPAKRAKTDYTNIITEKHRDRLKDALDAASEAGAKVLRPKGDYGGKTAPALVIGAPEASLLLNEEIFGPILPIVPYDTLDEALDFINARSRPLALYLFTDEKDVQETVLDGAISGGVTINSTLLHNAQENIPFGGVGDSGMGAYHGKDGFTQFSHARGVFKPGFFNAFETMGPPYGKFADIVIKALSR